MWRRILKTLRADYGSTSTQRKGVYGPNTSLAWCVPPIVTLRRGDAAARAVIGPLTETRRGIKTGSRLRQSVCVVIVLRRRGTIISPLGKDNCTSRLRHWVNDAGCYGCGPCPYQRRRLNVLPGSWITQKSMFLLKEHHPLHNLTHNIKAQISTQAKRPLLKQCESWKQ